MHPVIRALGFAARHGRHVLVLGLAAGIALPDLALAMKPWIGEMVVGLLFIAALRVGPRQTLGALSDMRGSLGIALLYQVALPVAAILGFALVGWGGPVATALILMLAAPPISGSPNLTLLTGNDPAPSLRLLVVGTAILAATVVPVFWLAPSLGDAGDVMAAAARLLLVIGGAAGAAFLIRGVFIKHPSPAALSAIDGMSAMALAVVVIGLMSSVGPALWANPAGLMRVLAIAFAANFGLQIAMALTLRRLGPARLVAPLAIPAGNRNLALFLTALPASVTDPLLLFIGCYQIPMYLTPILLRRLYRPTPGDPAFP
ncbi:MAG: hypothetical protein ACTS3R_20295 [Inquilinaceae bacterium]